MSFHSLKRFYGHVVLPVSELVSRDVHDDDIAALGNLLNYLAACGFEIIQAEPILYRAEGVPMVAPPHGTELLFRVAPCDRYRGGKKVAAGVDVVQFVRGEDGRFSHRRCMSAPAGCWFGLEGRRRLAHDVGLPYPKT
jgi:hypothetical protein